ncbi:MAG: hypothetical protein ACR2J8_05105, partial [Thermomicrobiales bacterium]
MISFRRFLDMVMVRPRGKSSTAAEICPAGAADGTRIGVRASALALAALAALLALAWPALAEDAATNQAARDQVREALAPLRDSEAEQALGAYVPGEGATFAIELVRGPNAAEGQPAANGVRAWATYLMQTFGPTLTAVPAQERIAMSIEFYAYDDDRFHTLVLRADAAAVADAATYLCWLDGIPCDTAPGAAVSLPAATPPPIAPTLTATAEPVQANPTATATPSRPAATLAPAPTAPA